MSATAERSRDGLLSLIKTGQHISLGNRVRLTMLLSWPAMVAQIAQIVMQYIDAAMVGDLGAEPSASIGLMATSTWMFWGVCSAAVTGFSVQVANRIGANDYAGAQRVLKQSFFPAIGFSVVMAIIGLTIGGGLPFWLGAEANIAAPAATYFLIFSASLPIQQMGLLTSAMLRCSGNTLFPGIVNASMCLLDVIFNALLIFPTRIISIDGLNVTIPGADLGIVGAAIGTSLAELVAAAIMFVYLLRGNPLLNLKKCVSRLLPEKGMLLRAFKIGVPLCAEHGLMCSAQILITAIVAPLGAIAIAANAFAVTVESLCYMPGYGIAEAATTLVGQSLGAARRKLARSFAKITVISGILVMTLMGVIMYAAAPLMMEVITPVEAISSLGTEIVRIEAFAEPMFAAAIVCYGVFVGAGDTLMPSCMILGSIWGVRLTLAALLAPIFGLKGMWIAMAIELCFRGAIFLWRLGTDYWMKSNRKLYET